MAIAALIPELLRQCFVHLPREDLSKTSLVHRAWLSPSRDIYWSTLPLTLRDDSAELLVKVLGERTSIPRKIKGITIDESEDFEDPKGSLTELKTLVFDSGDNEIIAKLVGAAAPNLLSLAISPKLPGININMSSARSLVNLSIQTGYHPHNEHVLAAAATAISSAPASVEHVFLGIGPDTLEPAEQPDGANALWASIDAALAIMLKLRRVT
ncbi:hypothetical protein D7B24_001050 [Verticillium nonalfalfae]|uniref:F-box domain-containing protein n=1 Tax=Verticillium nonalfalfae TaxID=1051616 RepID=A0A3M9YIN4_9PEZI|nr:uncharacterized protein D7B24_001050 [Verticillium nonalfalfae]RNJ59812.1 hypothetical protein D7B24_001050 [Verticillium nonalfalfae]